MIEAIKAFELALAAYTGAPEAVAVDSCSAALFLSCVRLRVEEVEVPARTYCSVPAAVIHAGGRVRFVEKPWHGSYQLRPYPIVDSAMALRRGMYERGTLTCLSFQYRKHIPIGRGGAILTDDADAAKWFRLARFNGREAEPIGQGAVRIIGWHMFMEPERALRGLELLRHLPDRPLPLKADYPDLRLEPAYRELQR